ncbi:MAG: nucleotidyl transferase AbiEii/AbiGii toxin family protein [Chloroflexi bacterium]|nr:nucleotidyl transferase AbiEii/AbiGii toxin family protein [Chloroflexota bacterium]MBI3742542.1 nucleotidyl transferase AbiEii/AbiGii toxin family protein [Chloroflexota bacterium]
MTGFPYWEALTLATRAAFEKASTLPFIQQFYLAGGTGLALHLGHRYSVDLDFFSADADAVGGDTRSTLRATFDDATFTITHDKDATFVAEWHGVGISFFRLNLYPLVQTPLVLNGVPLATIEEIGAMKLAAIIDRGTRKDLVDLYYILKHAPIEKLFQVAAVKYARVRTFPITATRALAYFEDAEALPMPRMIDRTSWSTMKRFLEKQAMLAGRSKLQDLWKDKDNQ